MLIKFSSNGPKKWGYDAKNIFFSFLKENQKLLMILGKKIHVDHFLQSTRLVITYLVAKGFFFIKILIILEFSKWCRQVLYFSLL